MKISDTFIAGLFVHDLPLLVTDCRKRFSHRRPSRPREDADIFSRLSGAGFSAADRVVVDGQYLLTDGAKISSGNP
jgi:hypothetical protein